MPDFLSLCIRAISLNVCAEVGRLPWIYMEADSALLLSVLTVRRYRTFECVAGVTAEVERPTVTAVMVCVWGWRVCVCG